MADVVFVVLLLGLFAVTAGVVTVCDRLVGGDEEVTAVTTVEGEQGERSAA